MIASARITASITVKRTVARGRKPNAHYRTREYLIEREVERLMKAAGNNRNGHRDATMILLAFRHGLRASELCSLRWAQVDLVHGRLHVSRAKNGIDMVHPQYLNLASQCEALARSAKNDAERVEYRRRADLWHRLAKARLPEGISRSHFNPRRRRNKA